MECVWTKEAWEMKVPFRITRKTMTHVDVVRVRLIDGAHEGQGEGIGVDYKGDGLDHVLSELERIKPDIEKGITRDALQDLLPGGGARNALDCAFWDLEAKKSGVSAWKTAGFDTLKPLNTALTIGLEDPDTVTQRAKAAAGQKLFKLKLGKDGDLERLQALRAAAPDAAIIIDANEGWSMEELRRYDPQFAALGVKMIEQPLKAGADEALKDYTPTTPLCADESCIDRSSLPDVIGKYQYVNIKLDKTGGLTEALALAKATTDQGLRLMVGCMAGTSLSMAPAFLIGQMCDFVDLDGPLLQKEDRPYGLAYADGVVSAPSNALWG